MQFSLRRCQPGDAASIARMMGDEAVYPGLLQTPFPSEPRWRQTLEGNDAPGNTDLVLVAVAEGEVVGSAGLHSTGKAVRRRHAMGIGISVAREAQGQGIGSALMAALTDYADNWGHVLRLELTVYADNAPAIRLYERHGFEHEGRQRAFALRDGAYVDALAMARLHPKPPRLPTH
jgi:putative acetyltransferase